MHPIFKFREAPTEEIICLLESVTLGTDGAHYRHLDTRERIQDADNPLFLSMERHEKVLSNITFCRREKQWYIRYFAFDEAIQAGGNAKSSSKNGLLKRELNHFFEEQLRSGEVESFYAYIDPRNVKSLWISEHFSFNTVAKIATQTYSSVRKPKMGRVKRDPSPNDIPSEISGHFGSQRYYHTAQLEKGTHYFIRGEHGELLAFAKTTVANWEIKRLPGKFGRGLVKVIPFVPFLNRLIKPNAHRFVVPEAVFVKNNDPALFHELFDGILAHEQQRVIIWWVDENDPTYSTMRSDMRWGLLHRLVGVNEVHLVERSLDAKPNAIHYTSGFDFV